MHQTAARQSKQPDRSLESARVLSKAEMCFVVHVELSAMAIGCTGNLVRQLFALMILAPAGVADAS